MNYDDMPAGPEIDRAVAELVLGWTYLEEPDLGLGVTRRMYLKDGRFVRSAAGDQLALGRDVKPFCPSTDLNAAVEACGRFAFGMGTCVSMPGYSAHVFSSRGAFSAYGATPALALCRALLKAVGP